MKAGEMTAAKHMPGPWKVGLRGTAVLAQAPHAKVCDIRGWGYLTGNGEGALGLPEAEAVAIQLANARLIAAAPDLLIQLEGLLGLVNVMVAAFDVDTEQTKCRLRLDGEVVAEVPISTVLGRSAAAIAKARRGEVTASTGEGVNA